MHLDQQKTFSLKVLQKHVEHKRAHEIANARSFFYWLNPRSAVRQLSHNLTKSYYKEDPLLLAIAAVVSLILIIELMVASLVVLKQSLFIFLHTLKIPLLLIALVIFSAVLGIILFIVSILGLFFWMSAKLMRGHATYDQTRLALLWTLVCFIPLSSLILVALVGIVSIPLFFAALPIIFKLGLVIVLLMALFYGLFALVITISQVNKLSKVSAVFSIIIAGCVLYRIYKILK